MPLILAAMNQHLLWTRRDASIDVLSACTAQNVICYCTKYKYYISYTGAVRVPDCEVTALILIRSYSFPKHTESALHLKYTGVFDISQIIQL